MYLPYWKCCFLLYGLSFLLPSAIPYLTFETMKLEMLLEKKTEIAEKMVSGQKQERKCFINMKT